ncbi:peptidase S9 domain-containing protein [Citrus sinensis]|nr:peptidase S9 domain-containing protein [Citrus sinensis]
MLISIHQKCFCSRSASAFAYYFRTRLHEPALVKVADRLSKERATSAVYSSDLKRAFETAQIIGSKCGDLEVITDPDLRERHLDDLQGFVLQEAVELKLDAYLVSLSSRTDQEIPECSRLLPKSSKVFDFLVEAADVSHLNKTGYLETALGVSCEGFIIIAITTLTRFSASSSSASINFKYIFSRRTVFTASPKRQKQRGCKIMASTSPVPETYSATQDKITAPYGSWKSPLTADVVSGASKRLGGTAVDGHGRLIWLESRPTEAGRGVLVKEPAKAGDEPSDITPKEYAVRTTAQEYGGGAFRIFGDTVIFSNYKDQRLYKHSIDSKDSSPLPITPDYGEPLVSYADGIFDPRFNRYVTVREDRRQDALNSTTEIVAIGLNGQNIQEMSTNVFVLLALILQLWSLRLNPSGPPKVLKFELLMLVSGAKDATYDNSYENPSELFFVTDRKNGFWNLHKWIESNNEVLAIYSLDAEFSRPLWVFGINSYEIIQSHGEKNLIACSYRQNGRSYLGILDDFGHSLSLLDIPFTDIDNITLGNDCLFVEGASGVEPSSVAKVTLDDHKLKAVDFKVVWSSSPDTLKYKSYFSLPELIEFPTEVPGQKAYAYYYPPSNPIYQASPEEKPPLLVKSHGGPTSEARGILNLSIQYWTSRGWAFVDVNYGGSTGYGREFRERLLGRWGIVDVNDCCSCATFLVGSGKADEKRLCITGGSAGGYTTLAALAFRDTFKAGASLYGVADLSMLRAETHKFESRYIDNLVGSEKDYYEKSPINFVDKFSCPIILFQGLEDKVVPPDQARKIYKALKENGLPVALVEYEGEQHGFRKAENIKFTLEQQMVFFARVVGHFDVADEIIPIKIDNFD